MSAGTWIEVLTLVLGGGGGGAAVVARLTRLVVAVEDLAAAMKTVTGQVADHEKRLAKGGL